MAETVAAIAAAMGTTTAAMAFQTLVVVGMAAINAQDARDKRRAALNAYNDSLQDRDVMVRSGVAPRNVIYGRAKVSGPIVFAHSTGTKGEYLHLVVALAGHECDAVEKIYFNEVELPALDGNGFVQSGPFSRTVTRHETVEYSAVSSITLAHTPSRIISVSIPVPGGDPIDPEIPYTLSGSTLTLDGYHQTVIVNYEWTEADPVVRIKVHLGGAGQVADPDLVAECGDKWTSAHRGDGITYLYVRLRYDQDIFGQVGLPNISALMRGAKPYDPRTGLTVWSDNSALCTAHYLRHATLGLGSSSAEVPDAEVSVAANVSDETVSIVDFKRAALATLWATDGDAEGWTASGAVATVSASQLRLASSGGDPILRRTGLSIAGASNTTVRVRIKRESGAGWQGTVYYTTAGHGESASYYKAIPEPTYDANGWAVAEWNMAALSAGGTDWTSNTITGVRLSLGTSSADVFYLDWVAVGSENTQRRYTTNGSISTAEGRRANLEALLAPMAGSAVFVQGRWLVRAGAHRSYEFTLDESWLAGGRIRIMPKRPRTDLFNAVTGTFIDPAQAYAQAQAPIVSNATYEAEDGGKRITRSVTMPLIDESVRAQRLNKITLERSRQALAFEAVCNMRAYDTLPTQVGRVNLARYGFANKLFEVRRRVFNPLERTVTLTLVEIASTVWDWQYGEATSRDPAPNTSLPSTAEPAALTGLAVASGTAQLTQLADGTLITRGLVSWTQSTDVFVVRGGRVEIEWKLPANTSWQSAPPVPGDVTSTYIGPLDDRELTIVRVRPVNSAGRLGAWTYINHLVQGKTAAPVNVAGLTATVVQSGVRIAWTHNTTDLDYDHTELRVGASWGAGTLLFSGAASTYTWLSPATGSYTVWAKHYDTTGNESATAVSLAITVDATMAVQWANVNGRPKSFRVVARGNSDTTAPVDANLYDGESGAILQGRSRSYMLARIRRSDGAITWWAPYDVYGSGASGGRTAADLAADLNATGTDHIAVVYTFDEPMTNRFDSGLATALYRCGASRGVFGSPQFMHRSAYILIGIGGCGEGNGYEAYSGAVYNDTNAWCEVTFQLHSGNFIISGNSATPRTLADYSYTGDLNATSDLTLISHGASAMTISGNTVTKPAGAAAAWDSGVYSKQAFPGAASVSWTVAQNDKALMVGLNQDPTTDANYTSLDAAIYCSSSANIEVYESGALKGNYGAYAAGDTFTVHYDGATIRYIRNGTVFATTSWLYSGLLYFDSSFGAPGGQITNVRFVPLSPVAGITTAQVGPQQITVHGGASLTGSVSYGASDTVILGTTIDTGGSGLYVAWDLYYQDAVAGTSTTLKIKVNGVTQRTVSGPPAPSNLVSQRVGSSVYIPSPGVGVLNVTLTASNGSGGGAWPDGFLYCSTGKR
jgi:hypothetical protein